MRTELNLVKPEENVSRSFIVVGVKSMTGDRLPGENLILKVDGESEDDDSEDELMESCFEFVARRGFEG